MQILTGKQKEMMIYDQVKKSLLIHKRYTTKLSLLVSSPAKRRRPATICAVSEGKEPFPGLNEMMSKLAEREKISDVSPGIQHHTLPTQSSISRPSSSNATLRPIIAEKKAPNHHTTTMNTTVTRNNEDSPPPVPPKPIVIRADQMFDTQQQQQQQWQFTPVQQRRQTMW
jgi:hypothetical protein